MGAGLCFHGRCRSRHIASAVVRSGHVDVSFAGDPRSHVGGIYYLPGSRPSAPWRRVVVRDVQRAGRGLLVLVASSDEEFWVSASCLFFRV